MRNAGIHANSLLEVRRMYNAVGIDAVSYTHLDVYKRQMIRLSRLKMQSLYAQTDFFLRQK